MTLIVMIAQPANRMVRRLEQIKFRFMLAAWRRAESSPHKPSPPHSVPNK